MTTKTVTRTTSTMTKNATPFRLSRRALLRGVAASIALPTLECMLNTNGTALAAGGALPKRFIVWYWGNGVVPRFWAPTGSGADWQLSPSLMPLAKVKPYVTVASGFDVKCSGGLAHHEGKVGILSATNLVRLPGRNTSKFGGPSIDQIVAQKIGGETRLPFVGLGVCKDGIISGEGPTLQYLSHKDSDSPVATEWNAQALFDRLFGGATPAMGGAAPDAGEKGRRAVLDAVREDARSLQAKLGAADRIRLDAHLTGIADLQRQISAMSAGPSVCTKPMRPGALTPGSRGANVVQLNQVMADLTRYALACDLTRVVAFHFSGETGYHYLPLPGATGPHHEMTHDAGKEAVVQATVVWTMERLAALAEGLMNTPEGAGNLLGQSIILATSGCASGYAHTSTDYPILLLGGGGGGLKAGIHVRKPKGNATDVLLAVHRALGTGVTAMGKDGLASTNVAGELVGA